MSNIEKKKEQKLTTYAELTTDVENAFKHDQLNALLTKAPPKQWVKVHPYIKGHNYLPIDKVEWMLRKIFKRFRIEVLEFRQLLNTISCSVRVHYLNPISGDWDYHDGVGACELQTQKDTGMLQPDGSNLNRGAIQMALPIAKSFAIKDACDHLGDVFGGNLNRKNVVSNIPDEELGERYNSLLNFINDDNENAEEVSNDTE